MHACCSGGLLCLQGGGLLKTLPFLLCPRVSASQNSRWCARCGFVGGTRGSSRRRDRRCLSRRGRLTAPLAATACACRTRYGAGCCSPGWHRQDVPGSKGWARTSGQTAGGRNEENSHRTAVMRRLHFGCRNTTTGFKQARAVAEACGDSFVRETCSNAAGDKRAFQRRHVRCVACRHLTARCLRPGYHLSSPLYAVWSLRGRR